MKKIKWIIVLCAVVLSLTARASTNVFQVGTFGTDRYPASLVSVDGNIIDITLSGADALSERPHPFDNSFYDWQGVARLIIEDVTGSWNLEGTLVIPDTVSPRTGLMMARLGGPFGVEDPSNLDYAAVIFSTANQLFYAWDPQASGDGYVPLPLIPFGPGDQDVEIKFVDDTFEYYFGGVLGYTDTTVGPNANHVTAVFIEALNELESPTDTATFTFKDVFLSLDEPGFGRSSFAFQLNDEPGSVPEPSTWFGAGIVALMAVHRFFQKRTV